MLPTQTIEELLSVSYVSAIIARSGFSPNPVARDYGVDLEVRKIATYGSKRIDCGAVIDLQFKASVNWHLDGDSVIYDLEADAYNRLVFRRHNSALPCVLIVYCLPRDDAQWLAVCEDDLVLRKCCYYYLVEGPESSNARSKRIRIPRGQLLTPDSLAQLNALLYSGELE